MSNHRRALLAVAAAVAAMPVAGASAMTFTPPTPGDIVLNTVTGSTANPGPWVLGQGNPVVAGSPYTPYSRLLPTFAFGGTPSFVFGGLTYANVASEPGGTGAPGFPNNVAGAPGPLSGYCGTSGPSATPATGPVNRMPAGVTLPAQPYYFPFVVRNADGTYTGYFDYRAKDTDEAIVAATSPDLVNWTFQGQALESNKDICPNGNTNDDGQGHQITLDVPSYAGAGGPAAAKLLYTLNRPAGNADVPGSQLLVHKLTPGGANPLAGLPASEPVGNGGVTTSSTTGAVPVPGAAAANITVGSTAGFELPGRVYDTTTHTRLGCVSATATLFKSCTLAKHSQYPGTTTAAGDRIAADPIVPQTSDATLPQPSGPDPSVAQTKGLLSPDGIIGTVPTYPGAPAGSTVVLYTQKLKGFFAPATLSGPTTVSPSFTLPVGSTTGIPGAGGATVTVGDDTAGTLISAACSGRTATALTGCVASATNGDVLKSGNAVGIAGACTTPAATLTAIGEGSTKVADLFTNNEDYTQVRAAYTTDGITFTGLADPVGLNDPARTSGPKLRFVGSRGTIVAHDDGTYTMFNSGGTCTDGDSDAFSRIFTSTSYDNGAHWTTPKTLISTDYTFAQLAAFEAAPAGTPLPISAYYAGRVYDPSVVTGPTGDLSMVFSGYRTPKPTPKTGAVLGRDPSTGQPLAASLAYTVGKTDPALYRNILTVGLTVTPDCTTTLTGRQTGALVVSSGTTCLKDAQVSGAVIVKPGAGLTLIDSTVQGSVGAKGAASARVCNSTIGGSLNVSGATGFVLVGDSGDDNCPANTIGGALILKHDTGGLEAIGNHTGGAVLIGDNAGIGPFDEDTAPEASGNG